MLDKDHIQRLIKNHLRRLQKLKELKALEGLDSRPGVLIEIEDIEAELNKLQAQLEDKTKAKRETIGKAVRGLEKQLDEVEQYFHIPFTNQTDKIETITSSSALPYYLLDAPAGYGKTELLKELGRRFEERGWVCAYVCADEYATAHKLIGALSKELNLNKPLNDTPVIEDLGETLCGQLKIERRDDITRKGIVLLIDLGKKPSPKLISDLVNRFIPDVQSCLRVDQFFASRRDRFRVVLAGRYLANHKEISSTLLPLTILQLSPFSYKDLQRTAQEYLPDVTENVIRQLPAHIMYLSGGHLGCMASILRLYKLKGQPDPDRFIERNSEKIQELIETEISEVYDDIPNELQDTMNILGIFRYLSHSILAYTIQVNKELQKFTDEYTLADDLTINFLFTRDNRRLLLRNDNHRILVLQIRKQEKIDKLAQNACKEYLSRINARIPEIWALEYLYQFLQHNSGNIENKSGRQKIRKIFFDEIPAILKVLTDSRNIQGVKRNLETVLQADNEFKFVVNYFLRHDEYSNEPFEKLLGAISQFFDNQIRNAGDQNA